MANPTPYKRKKNRYNSLYLSLRILLLMTFIVFMYLLSAYLIEDQHVSPTPPAIIDSETLIPLPSATKTISLLPSEPTLSIIAGTSTSIPLPPTQQHPDEVTNTITIPVNSSTPIPVATLTLLPPSMPTPTLLPFANAIVNTQTLKLYRGPNTGDSRIEELVKSSILKVVGQTQNCSWLKVITPSGQEGWILRVNVILNMNCGLIPEIKIENDNKSDLTITSVVIESNNLNSLKFSYTIQNKGSAPVRKSNLAQPNYVAMRLSISDEMDNLINKDVVFYLPALNDLQPSQSYSYYYSTEMNSDGFSNASGKVYLTVFIDSENIIDEEDENNNYSKITITLPEFPIVTPTNVITQESGFNSITVTPTFDSSKSAPTFTPTQTSTPSPEIALLEKPPLPLDSPTSTSTPVVSMLQNTPTLVIAPTLTPTYNPTPTWTNIPILTPSPTWTIIQTATSTITLTPAPTSSPTHTLDSTPLANCALSQEEKDLEEFLLTDAGQMHPNMHCNPLLVIEARRKAQDMADRIYFAHVDPDGFGPNYRVQQGGYVLPDYYGTEPSANNIESIGAGYPDAASAWNAWMLSLGHRSHLLGENQFYRDQYEYGIGYVYKQNGSYSHYWVVLIAQPKQ